MINKKMNCKSIFCLILIFIMLSACILPVSAANKSLDTYTINDGETIPTPESYEYSHTLNCVVATDGQKIYFNQPTDIFCDKQDNIYVADTANNRVIKMSSSGKLIHIYSEYAGKTFSQPQGIFVEENGDVYISDTGNNRIVHITASGQEVGLFTKPDSPMLADIDVFSPTKIAVNNFGILYVLMGERIMSVDENNNFRGFIGQTDIGFSLVDWLLRIFASSEQMKSVSKRTADNYENFCLSDEGYIYAASRDTQEGQIKILNTVGNNIYKTISAISNENKTFSEIISNLFSGNVISKKFTYGEVVDGRSAIFSDICFDENGIVTVIESNNCMIYQYDQLGNLLCVFGGKGTAQGKFNIPTSLVADSLGNIYILDQSNGNITIYEPTAFIKTVQAATCAYDNGDYDGAEKLWKSVLEINETYPLAHYGLGNLAYKDGNYDAAMEYYRFSNDRKEYSKAFSRQRYNNFRENFFLVVVIVAVFTTLLLIGIFKLSKASKKILIDFELARVNDMTFGKTLLLSVNILFRPIRFMDAIRYGREKLSTKVATVYFAAMFVVRMLFIYVVHYPLQDIELSEVNVILEFVKIIVPFITWVCASYLVSSQFDGECTFKENYTTVGFCMLPYVIINVVAMCMSHILSYNEKGLFAVFVNGVIVWMVILLICAVKQINDYTIGRTIVVSVISLIAVILIWFVFILSYAMIGRVVLFGQEIISEIKLML